MKNYKEISDWFDKGVVEGYKFMVIKRDIYNQDLHPSYCINKEKALLDSKYAADNEHKTEEIYDLSKDKTDQIIQYKTWEI